LTTLNELANRCNRALADQAGTTWSDTDLEQWIIEGLRDYSLHFPLLKTGTISTTADQHDYELPSDCIRLDLVEYPTGEDPPEYLRRYSRKNQDFWDAEGFYDVAHSGTSDVSGTYTRGTLWISEDPADSETITLTYYAYHPVALVSGSELSIPEEQEHILVLFAVWKACTHQLMNEQQSPDTTKALLDSYRRAAYLAREDYQTALRQAKAIAAHSGPTGPWRSDDWDRIY
jgi:hypothetical protein